MAFQGPKFLNQLKWIRAGMVGAVSKISALQPEGPRFNLSSDKIWIFVWLSFPLKLAQLSMLPG